MKKKKLKQVIGEDPLPRQMTLEECIKRELNFKIIKVKNNKRYKICGGIIC